MRYSHSVALTGVVVAIMGAIAENDIITIAGFIHISASCICRSIERKREQSGGS